MKTVPTEKNVVAFIDSIENEQRKKDCTVLKKLMEDWTGFKPVIWGDSIIGYGNYHYKYESGREGDSILTGFSPRKQNLTIYITSGFRKYPDLMEKLGKYKTSLSCLYIKKLSDINSSVLEELVKKSVDCMANYYK